MVGKPNQGGCMGWQDYFCLLSNSLKGHDVEIEIVSKHTEFPVHLRSKILHGPIFDASQNKVALECESFEHVIPDPVAVYVQADDLHLKSFVLVQRNGSRHTLRFPEVQ